MVNMLIRPLNDARDPTPTCDGRDPIRTSEPRRFMPLEWQIYRREGSDK